MTQRAVYSLDSDWRVLLGDCPDAARDGFNDAGWRVIDVPHDWVIEGEYRREHPGGRRQAFLPNGVAWYRKTFDVPAAWLAGLVSVEFDGVYMNSDLWINGVHLGHRPFGYLPIYHDLMPHLRPGANTLAVRVDTSAAPTDRWYAGAGITRHVRLIATGGLRIARHGVWACPVQVSPESARLDVEVSLHNDSGAGAGVIVTRLLPAPGGHPLAEERATLALTPGHDARATLSLFIAQPRLWSPESPTLHTLSTELHCDGQVLDRVETPVGFRYFEFDAARGFSLNGVPMKFKGVCNHHDAGPLGAAVPDRVLFERLRQLKDMGCNAIRTSHNPFAPEFYDFCDQLGLLVMDEIFDGWHEKAEHDYGAIAFEQWWRRDLEEWVRRDRNHPCVILWSIGNETGKVDIHGMTAIIHALDPSRPVTGGEVHDGVDVAGFNGQGGIPGALEAYHAANPDRKIVLTEKPHTYQTRGFYRTRTWWREYKNPRNEIAHLTDAEVFSDDYAAHHPHTVCYNSSYDNSSVRMSARWSWARTRDNDWIAGEFRWTGFDYLGESYGWPLRMGNHGIIDVCGFPKDLYYFYQSQWTACPMVHLLPHWTHPGREGVIIPVWAYSNCEEVELFLNGRSLGVRRPGRAPDDMQCAWDVAWAPGALRAEARRAGETVATDEVHTAGPPAILDLAVDGAPARSDAPAAVSVVFRALDAAGHLAPMASNRLFFDLQGAGALRHDNGDPADLEPHGGGSRRLFRGLARAYVLGRPVSGPLVLTAAAILGDTWFAERTMVSIAVHQAALRGEAAAAAPVIHINRNGRTPTEADPVYGGPFELREDADIAALVIVGARRLMIRESFRRGPGIQFQGSAGESTPLSRSVAGRWRDAKGVIHEFRENGELAFIKDGEVMDVRSWWYQDPLDAFEDAQGDCDNGAIIFSFDEAGLKLKDGRLRLRRRSQATWLDRVDDGR